MEENIKQDEQKQQADKYAEGEMELNVPFMSNGHEVTSLRYNFKQLRGMEILQIRGSMKGMSINQIPPEMAFDLFCAAVERTMQRDPDKESIRAHLSAMDLIEAVERTTLFWSASVTLGLTRISKA
jgi:hypothetical protein